MKYHESWFALLISVRVMFFQCFDSRNDVDVDCSPDEDSFKDPTNVPI